MRRQFITQSNYLLKQIRELRVFKNENINIHISGESGTGKELIAKMIYELEEDGHRPFVAVNSSAIPKNLVESVLFGHEKGSFTGAINTHKGKFEQADGGDIYLDEISELPIEVQAKLLRVLQENEIDRIGGTDVIKSNFRLISASNKDLRMLVKEDKFREDLYYRINMHEIKIPALRERKADIPLLVKYFIGKSEKKIDISAEAMDKLYDYDWPGNVRELENVIRLAIAVTKKDKIEKEAIRFKGIEKFGIGVWGLGAGKMGVGKNREEKNVGATPRGCPSDGYANLRGQTQGSAPTTPSKEGELRTPESKTQNQKTKTNLYTQVVRNFEKGKQIT